MIPTLFRVPVDCCFIDNAGRQQAQKRDYAVIAETEESAVAIVNDRLERENQHIQPISNRFKFAVLLPTCVGTASMIVAQRWQGEYESNKAKEQEDVVLN